MREIKVRAWDTIDKIMFTKGIGINTHTLSMEVVARTKDIILMQYTGLKDKNGKEMIYEGDILKDKYGDIGEIFYEDGMFNWGTHGIYKELIKQFGLEVIGNIYENPELIKEVNK